MKLPIRRNALTLLLLCGCAGVGGMTPAQLRALRLEGTMPVTAIDMWTSRYQVPTQYRHAIDWHGWSGPVNVVFSGQYVCTNLSDGEWTLVQLGDRPKPCRWYGPRGI
jgi:hypothetical protein